MSKSKARVTRALEDAGLAPRIVEAGETRTAEQAAAAVGCALDQIVKSIIYRGTASGEVILFLTAGGNRVDDAKASALAGEPLGKADAALSRAQTGFAIGGTLPVDYAMMAEFVPTAWRGRFLVYLESFWAVGTMRGSAV